MHERFGELVAGRDWRDGTPWLADACLRDLLPQLFFDTALAEARAAGDERPLSAATFVRIAGDEADALALAFIARDISERFGLEVELRDPDNPIAKLRHVELVGGRLPQRRAAGEHPGAPRHLPAHARRLAHGDDPAPRPRLRVRAADRRRRGSAAGASSCTTSASSSTRSSTPRPRRCASSADSAPCPPTIAHEGGGAAHRSRGRPRRGLDGRADRHRTAGAARRRPGGHRRRGAAAGRPCRHAARLCRRRRADEPRPRPGGRRGARGEPVHAARRHLARAPAVIHPRRRAGAGRAPLRRLRRRPARSRARGRRRAGSAPTWTWSSSTTVP